MFGNTLPKKTLKERLRFKSHCTSKRDPVYPDAYRSDTASWSDIHSETSTLVDFDVHSDARDVYVALPEPEEDSEDGAESLPATEQAWSRPQSRFRRVASTTTTRMTPVRRADVKSDDSESDSLLDEEDCSFVLPRSRKPKSSCKFSLLSKRAKIQNPLPGLTPVMLDPEECSFV